VHDLTEERVAIGDLVLTLARPAEPERLLDEDAFGDDEFLPYWAELWPSGLALAQHISELELHGQRVLELGCGLGLPSLVAASAGADVLATDWAPEAVELLQRNAARNGVRLRTAVVRWEDAATFQGEQFDVVLASDVVYEARNAQPLLAAVDHALAHGGEALVADPGRRHAGEFLDAARTAWTIEERATERLRNGAIYRLRRR
jgi:predicted nicotinamide N-methyase